MPVQDVRSLGVVKWKNLQIFKKKEYTEVLNNSKSIGRLDTRNDGKIFSLVKSQHSHNSQEYSEECNRITVTVYKRDAFVSVNKGLQGANHW